jgi:nucleosome-remodeling factor subunit BPTF
VCTFTDFFPGSLKHLTVFPPISKFEEIDITKALTSRGRLHYPKVAKKSRLDEFLTRRTHLKLLEERKFAQSVSGCSYKYVIFHIQ